MESIYMLKGELPEDAFDGIMGPLKDCALHNLALIHDKLSSADGPLDALSAYETFFLVSCNLFPRRPNSSMPWRTCGIGERGLRMRRC
eukprot:8392085-Pyramimonas_sp.AAC.1